MKKYSKILSLASLVLLFSISTFVACKRDINDTAPSVSNTVKVTAESLANDSDFQNYLLAENEMKAKFVFLNVSKTKEERRKALEDFGKLGRVFNSKGKNVSASELEKAAYLLGYTSVFEMNTVIKDLLEKRNKLQNSYPILKDIDNPINQALFSEAFALSQNSLPWMVVYTKRDGTHAINKVAWRNNLKNVSTLQLRCCPTPWEHSCDGTPCEDAAMDLLQSKYNGCGLGLAVGTLGCGLGCWTFMGECPPCAFGCAAGCELLAGEVYGNCLDQATGQYDLDIENCD